MVSVEKKNGFKEKQSTCFFVFQILFLKETGFCSFFRKKH